ncbi:hypothetical protein N9C31_00545 [Gammaproteobacteria bacterium]|nr:hypothetical protein [Gammaproteobacteria bacterium]
MGALKYDVIINNNNISGKIAALQLSMNGFKAAFLSQHNHQKMPAHAYVALNLHHLKTLNEMGICPQVTYFRQIDLFFDHAHLEFESKDIYYPAFSGAVNLCELEKILNKKIGSIPVLTTDHWKDEGRYLLRTKLDEPACTPITYLSHQLSASIVTIAHWPTKTARQYFKNQSIYGFLPTHIPGQFSLVHSSKVPHLTLDDLKQLNIDASQIEHQQPYFQASTYHTDRYVNHNEIGMHNACHMIHPMAGFGLNMGLSDLSELIKQLGCDDLKTYAQKRHLQNLKTLTAISGLYHLYCDPAWQNAITDKGIYLTNACPLLKSFFTHQAITV